MPSVHSIFKDIKALTDSQNEELFNNISEIISVRAMTSSLYSDSREQRFFKGVVCLRCGGTHVINTGKRMAFSVLDAKITKRHLTIEL